MATTLESLRLETVRAPRRMPDARLLLALILVVTGVTIATAMRRTSPTFDEIVFVAGGARGYTTGEFNLAPDHPPLMQYIYGLPVWLDGVKLPDESGVSPEMQRQPSYRYKYSQVLYYANGNDPERVSFLGRLPAVLFALTLITVLFFYVRRYWGDAPAVLAALLAAFLPDVLAHGGVAYSDLPVALALFGAAWAIDAALRASSYRLAIAAGALTGIAVCVKISAAILLPLAVGLAVLEYLARRTQPPETRDLPPDQWLKRLAPIALFATAAAYLTIVLVYRGDFMLEEFRFGLAFRLRHMNLGHGAAGFLLGDTSTTGWWYFFPVAFLYKTSAGLHLLLLVALSTLVWRVTQTPAAVLSSRLRMPVLAALIFGVALLRSNLNIGFRYAMPMLPLVCVVTAAGIAVAWPYASRFVRGAVVLATVWAVVFPLTYYPHFLPFISEYGPGRDRGHEVLLDSSFDWGQGLIELRDYLRDKQNPRIYLSYFGSGWPAGYGIDYVPMYSFFALPQASSPEPQPEYVVISATNRAGIYFTGDPFSAFREIEPDTILAHTMFVYHVPRGGQ